MRLAMEIAIGVAAGGIAYHVARPATPAPVAPRPATQRNGRPKSEPTAQRAADHARDRGTVISTVVRGPAAANTDPGESRQSIEQRAAMTALRNAVIVESSRDMSERGEALPRCLDGVVLAGPEKLRFTVDVESTPTQAILRHWRFVEVVDGEPLPAGFASCAARVLGSGQRVVPDGPLPFPDYRGELSFVYTLPAPGDAQ